MGSTEISYGVDWNIDANGEEQFDKFGELAVPSTVKYVNGVLCMNYGEQPKTIFNGYKPIAEWDEISKQYVIVGYEDNPIDLNDYTYYADYIDENGERQNGLSHPDVNGFSTVYPI
jgi:hypothetical protein